MPARQCLTCRQLTSRPSKRGLCPECQQAYEAARPARRVYDDPRWRRLSSAAVRRHVRLHGWVCPGYEVPRHPSTDLTADHPVALATGGEAYPKLAALPVLCRACNGRKAAAPATR